MDPFSDALPRSEPFFMVAEKTRMISSRAASDFFAAADFLAGAPRRPARGRALTVRGGVLGAQIILALK